MNTTPNSSYPVAGRPWLPLGGGLVLLVLFVLTGFTVVQPALETTEHPGLLVMIYLLVFAAVATAWGIVSCRQQANNSLRKEINELRKKTTLVGDGALPVALFERLHTILQQQYTQQGANVQMSWYVFLNAVRGLVEQYGNLRLIQMAQNNTLEKVLLGLPDGCEVAGPVRRDQAWTAPPGVLPVTQ